MIETTAAISLTNAFWGESNPNAASAARTSARRLSDRIAMLGLFLANQVPARWHNAGSPYEYGRVLAVIHKPPQSSGFMKACHPSEVTRPPSSGAVGPRNQAWRLSADGAQGRRAGP